MSIEYKYKEDKFFEEYKKYIDATYSEHYKTQNKDIQCFDAWISLGDATPTFRNTAIKYLWRYGKKNGNNKTDLIKAVHYIMMCIYNDHYMNEQNTKKTVPVKKQYNKKVKGKYGNKN